MKTTHERLNHATKGRCPFCNTKLKMWVKDTEHGEDCQVLSENEDVSNIAMALVMLWDSYWGDHK